MSNTSTQPEDIKTITMWDGEDQDVVKIAEKKISIARIDLNNRLPFFGRMTLLLDPVASMWVPTMGTDGEYLFFNPNFVVKNLTQQQLTSVILHEVLHCALLHLWRQGNRKQAKWNMACDYAINPIVTEQGLNLPEGALLDRRYQDLSAEVIYEKIPNPPKIKIKIIKRNGKSETIEQEGDWFSDKSGWGKDRRDDKNDQKKNGQGSGNGKQDKKQSQGKDNQGKANDSDDKKQKGKGSGSQSDKTQSKGSKDDKKQNGKGKGGNDSQKSSENVWSGKNKDLMDKLKGDKEKKDKEAGKKKGQKLEDFWEGVFQSAMRSTQQGDLPGYLERLYRELMPKKDWRKILANYLSKSNDDFNFTTPDRRFLESDFYLPDLHDFEAIEDVVIAVDTSGSISTWQFNHFISEVKSILKSFPKFRGWFISCDAEIQQVVEMKSEKEEDFNPRLRGGGGTDFNPVFKKIEKEGWRPRVAIYLTDGYGYFPNQAPDFPVIWLIDSEVEPPWGEKIKYEYDQKDMHDI